MEIKVRALGESEEKSPQEKEQEIINKHEAKEKAIEEVKQQVVEEKPQSKETPVIAEETPVAEEKVEEPKEIQLTDEDVLSHIKKKYNKEINSVEDLFQEREESEPLPEDVSAYLKYKKDTGRGIEDYVKLNKNFDAMDNDTLLRSYLKDTEDGLDDDDITDMMSEYEYDSEIDDKDYIRKTKLAKKRIIARAKKYFNEQKEYFKQPLESSTAAISDDLQKQLDSYKQSIESAKRAQSENEMKQRVFLEKTDQVFSSDFKGFEFTIGDEKFTYSPGDATTIKKAQSNPMNFVKKFIDENGVINNAEGYHRSLAIAMNPEKFAKFFYEQGKSKATEDVMRKTKNINMSERKSPEVTSKGGVQIRSLNTDSGRGLKIKSIKKK